MTASHAPQSVPSRRVLLLANRKSRNGRADLSKGIELLRERHVDVLEKYPARPTDVPDLIRRHREDVDSVLLGGGDGTLNCAAGALRETGLTLGILPMGTANDLARTLGIPTDLVQACGVVADGDTMSIDLGFVNDTAFFNAASIGLGVRVTRRLTSDVKARWGVFGYARAVYDVVRATRSFTVEIECDGKAERLRSIQVTIGNGRYYGGGMAVADDAAVDDGRLDLYSLRPQGFLKLLSLAPALRFGPREDADTIDVRRGTSIRIRTRRPRSVTADGEIATRTPAHFRVERHAIRVYVPAVPAD